MTAVSLPAVHVPAGHQSGSARFAGRVRHRERPPAEEAASRRRRVALIDGVERVIVALQHACTRRYDVTRSRDDVSCSDGVSAQRDVTTRRRDAGVSHVNDVTRADGVRTQRDAAAPSDGVIPPADGVAGPDGVPLLCAAIADDGPAQQRRHRRCARCVKRRVG